MANVEGYILGQSVEAARRLEIQDAHFDEVSEKLLDRLALQPTDRVVELGCGPGGFSRRILRRLGKGGVLVGVDATEGLLSQARNALATPASGARFEPTLANIAELGPWIQGADVVVGRAVLHHIPMVEFVLGRLRTKLRPGTRVGFIEPEFRTLLARISYLQATERPELSAFLDWATAINRLYLANGISPSVGATLAKTLEIAGYRNIRYGWFECLSNPLMIENMVMFFDEVRDRLGQLGIMTGPQVDDLKRALKALPEGNLPPAWGMHQVAAEV